MFIYIALAIFLVVLTANLMSVRALGDSLNEFNNLGHLKPNTVEITVLEYDECEECFDVEKNIRSLNDSNLEIEYIEYIDYRTEEGKELVEKLGIERVPNIVIEGETDGIVGEGFTEVDKTLFMEDAPFPYYNTFEEELRGYVEARFFENPDCDVCQDLRFVKDTLEELGMEVQAKEVYSTVEETGRFEEYDIDIVPSMILEGDIESYEGIEGHLLELGFSEKEDYFKINSPPPFVNRTTGEIDGLIDLTLIDDENCEECYDPEIHVDIIQQIVGAGIGEIDIIDVSEAEDKLEAYDVKKVPTVLLTGDTELYTGLEQIWEEVGTVEDDGTFVFREMEAIGQPYREIGEGVFQ